MTKKYSKNTIFEIFFKIRLISNISDIPILSEIEFSFMAHKVHIHRWPHTVAQWSAQRIQQIDQDINKNKEPMHVLIKDRSVQIQKYKFDSIKKIGITIPLFKKQSTMIFEGRCQEFDAHVHITTKSDNYLETFNGMMNWRATKFPDAFYLP